MLIIDILEASGLFESRSDIHRKFKGGARVFLNKVLVEKSELNNELEIGDLINGLMNGVAEITKEHGGWRNNVMIHLGKRTATVVNLTTMKPIF